MLNKKFVVVVVVVVVVVLLANNVASVCIGLKAHANGRNKCQQCCVRLHGPKSLTGFKLYATSANKSQHCWAL